MLYDLLPPRHDCALRTAEEIDCPKKSPRLSFDQWLPQREALYYRAVCLQVAVTKGTLEAHANCLFLLLGQAARPR